MKVFATRICELLGELLPTLAAATKNVVTSERTDGFGGGCGYVTGDVVGIHSGSRYAIDGGSDDFGDMHLWVFDTRVDIKAVVEKFKRNVVGMVVVECGRQLDGECFLRAVRGTGRKNWQCCPDIRKLCWHWLVLTNGVEVKLQWNALSMIEPSSGHEDGCRITE
eukprot:Gb_08934 [translate_table: standard]